MDSEQFEKLMEKLEHISQTLDVIVTDCATIDYKEDLESIKRVLDKIERNQR